MRRREHLHSMMSPKAVVCRKRSGLIGCGMLCESAMTAAAGIIAAAQEGTRCSSPGPLGNEKANERFFGSP